MTDECAAMPELEVVYRERAQLLALLATHYPAFLVHGADGDEPDWPVLFLELPTGQATWHISPRDTELFDHVPVTPLGAQVWDGHTTQEKYRRIALEARHRGLTG